MTINVVFFAAAREVTGCERLELSLGDAPLIADVQRELAVRYPELVPVLRNSMWSINCEYAGHDSAISDGAEVGLILPVSGG